jgi:SAM-dependent methyltransferase
MAQSETDIQIPNTWYDDVMFRPLYLEFYEDSDFSNFGYWDEGTTGPRQACENLVNRLQSLLPDKSGTILDVACGKGETTRCLLANHAPEAITAINISERQLEHGRTLAPGVDFRCMDAVNLEFADESFDNVMCVEAAFHFDTREAFLREALRVLRPGGALALSDILMTLEGERSRPYRTEANYLAGVEAYRKLLAAVGFTDVYIADVTEQSWFPFFRYTVDFLHEKFLRRQIDEPTLRRHLGTNYGHVHDLENYLIVSARKPKTNE